jgi:ubiquinone/menaquinone biosynthesis C-methylase UbiE
MGGDHFVDDLAFVESAVADVDRLQALAGLTADSRLLDWGCGAGRLAVGIKHTLGNVADYHGVDVQPQLIEWADENLSDEHTRFTLVDQANARYNPDGSLVREIPTQNDSVDVFYAYSVFSHMLVDDISAYLRVIARILAPTGHAIVTAFVEDDVPSWTENPVGYGPLTWTGRLHCVRYNKAFFDLLLRHWGLDVVHFEHGQETDGQSLYVLTRAPSRLS